MKIHKNPMLLIVGLFTCSFVTFATTFALAHGGDTNLIHACVRNNTLLPNSANIRIIGASQNCNGNETPLDWPKTAGEGSSDFVCVECTPRDLLFRLNSQSLTNATLDSAILTGSRVSNEDFSGSSFMNAVLSHVDAEAANFTDADFTNANLRSVAFNLSTLTGVNLTSADLSHATLSGATLTNANLTNVIWDATICPDNTNSDDNGNTCIGHLTP